VLLWLISRAATATIALVGVTLRASISWEDETLAPNSPFDKPGIYAFWHRSVLGAAWLYRNRGLTVMVSRSFDGEAIARVIERLGFRAVRGSSSRGGGAALLGMISEVEAGGAAAFTIDGPRGPKFVAKPGAVALARATGVPATAFALGVDRAWVLGTWDELMIPKPFAKVLIRMGRKIAVSTGASDEEMQAAQADMQAALERVTRFAEEHVAEVGSARFPIHKGVQS